MDSHHDLAPTRSNRMMPAAIAIAALVPFLASIAFGYVLDDTTVIRSNAALMGWSSLWRVWTLPYGGIPHAGAGLYRPVIMSVFAFVWNAGEHWPLWFHLVAIAMHVTATLFAWRVLRLALDPWPSALAAVWFAVHPVHVEAVANVANSAEVLVGIFTCALVLHLHRASRHGTIPGWRAAAVAGLLYAAAFLTKESGAFAPVIAFVALWGWTPDRPLKPLRRWWRVAAACATAAAIVIGLRLAVLGSPVSHASIAVTGVEGLDAIGRGKLVASLLPTIVRLLIWPSDPNPHYGPTFVARHGSATVVAVALSLGILVGLTARMTRRGERRAFTAIAWTIVAFLPASNLLVPTGQILAERTLYVPSIGVAMLAGTLMQLFVQYVPVVPPWRALRAGALAVVVVLLLVCLAKTFGGTMVWRSNSTVFAQMIRADSAGHRGYWLAGLDARYRGRLGDGIALLSRAYTLYPRERALLVDLSNALAEDGQLPRAASVAGGLMAFADMRADSAAVSHYLDLVWRAWGADSVRSAAARLQRDAPSGGAVPP